MADVERLQERRRDYLVALYQHSEGDLLRWATNRQLVALSGIPEDQIMTVGQQLVGQGTIELTTMGGLDGSVAITPAGVVAAEAIIAERGRAGQPLISGFVVLTDVELLRKLEPLLGELREAIEDSDVDDDTKSDLRADVDSTDVALRATNPNRNVIKAALSRIGVSLPVVGNLATIGMTVYEVLHGLGV